MNDINAPIPYEWKYSWGKQLSESQPIVNRLLKAALERDGAEVERLFQQGASLQATNSTTRRVVIYLIADCYPVMEQFVKHGMSRNDRGCEYGDHASNGCNENECLTPNGYFWGVLARALYLEAYDVAALLAANGFTAFNCFDIGFTSAIDYDRVVFREGIEPAIRILLEHGYVFGRSSFWREKYEEYVLDRPQVVRKSCCLDPLRFKALEPQPQLESVPLLFGRKDAIARNNRRIEDNADRIRALRAFRQNHRETDEQKAAREIVNQAVIELANRI